MAMRLGAHACAHNYLNFQWLVNGWPLCSGCATQSHCTQLAASWVMGPSSPSSLLIGAALLIRHLLKGHHCAMVTCDDPSLMPERLRGRGTLEAHARPTFAALRCRCCHKHILSASSLQDHCRIRRGCRRCGCVHEGCATAGRGMESGGRSSGSRRSTGKAVV